jgi:2-iminoacetate synthase ThiH
LDLLKSGEIVCRAQEVAMPNWYNETTKIGAKMPSIFLHEGRLFLHQTYSGCDYFSSGGQCKFCGTGAKWKIGKPAEIGETVGAAVKENNNYQVCLGGGNRLPVSRNIEYFTECVSEIRKRNSQVPIWIEMVPPETDEDIEKLVEAGATSFGFNIEIWDDKLRSEICPAKSKNSKDCYLSAMEKALSLLGKNRVGTCLIAGLEPISSSIKGAA